MWATVTQGVPEIAKVGPSRHFVAGHWSYDVFVGVMFRHRNTYQKRNGNEL